MQVTESLSQGLKREYKVVLPAADLAKLLDTKLAEMKDKVRINGFRPGKVPVAHLKRVYGKSVMGEIVQNAVNDANKKIVEDHGLRLALEPKIDFPGDQAEVERVLEAKGDLSFTVNLETLPKFEVGSFEDVEITRPVAEITEADVDAGVQRLANRNRTYTAKEDADAPAGNGDKVTLNFTGKVNGEAFEGGNGTGIDVTLGSNAFIPGFEQQLEGIKAGEQRLVKVTFPEAYTVAKLAGQAAEFDVTATAVAAADPLDIGEDFAKGFGFESVDLLKAAIKGNLETEQGKASRDKLKRSLLDALDKKYSFELPEGLVGMEFDNVWRQVSAEQTSSGRSFEQEGTTEEKAREEYRRIAERRVRLGLLLAEVGDKAGVQIKDDEVTAALVEKARAYPGQEKMVWDYYSKNQQALAELRAPIFEEKVIDHIVGLSKVTEKVVSREELFKLDEE